MARRRNVDWVSWHLYRRAWLVCAAAFLLVLVTGFRPQEAPEAPLPPSFDRAQAQAVIDRAREFDHEYPDRRPGTSSAVEAARWVQERFDELGVAARIVPQTTVSPVSHRPLSLSNVEASLAGRTSETIVVYAHRDTVGTHGAPAEAVDTIALLEFARDAIATRDRRRSYLFVSTDGAWAGAGGVRALAERLGDRGRSVVAVIGLDRIAAGTSRAHLPWTASGRWSQPLGLTDVALDAARREGGVGKPPSIAMQLLMLAAPVSLYEQGHLVRAGLPVVTVTTAGERRRELPRRADADATTQSMRVAQRTISALDGVDTLQSAGKTYLVGEHRAFRGWAIKILMATLLVPFWVAAVDLLARQLRRGRLTLAVGSVARAAIGGLWILSILWVLGAMGAFPAVGDRPPDPSVMGRGTAPAIAVWLALSAIGWLLVRGPDWRHRTLGDDVTRDRPRSTLAVALVGLGLLTVLMLSVNPYAVPFFALPLHLWLLLASTRTTGSSARMAVWIGGLCGPLLAFGAVTTRFQVPAHTAPWYWLELVQSRTVPVPLDLFASAGMGISLLVGAIALDNLERPAIVQLRRVRDALAAAANAVGGRRSPAERPDVAVG